MQPDFRWWSTSSGRIELQIDLADALTCGGQGRQDENVAALLRERYIRLQLSALSPLVIANELKEYGAWDAAELENQEDNDARLIWIACCDIAEESRTENE